MRKWIFLLPALFIALGCAKEPIRPVVSSPVTNINEEILANVTSLHIPRLLKIDQSLNIKVKGYFDQPGYGISRVNMHREDNAIVFEIYGKKTENSNSRFDHEITLPPQPDGEYDIIVNGKNKKINDILWIEQYRGEDHEKYLQRLKEQNRQP